MKKIVCISFIVFCSFIKSNAQVNLIPNAGFENVTQCSANFGYIYFAGPWFQPNNANGNTTNSSSSDLFDTCANHIFYPPATGIPSNYVGYQYAKTGERYAGFAVYTDTMNWQEYLEVPLMDTLKAGKKYCVEFYLSLSDSSVYAVSNVGVYFSSDSLLSSGYYYPPITNVIPQFENPISNMLNDTLNWMLVSGNFIASGGERFMTIGNFHSPLTSNSISVNNGSNGSGIAAAYYYIDDVSVIYCDPSEVEEMGTDKDNFNLYPNPNDGNIFIDYHLKDNENGMLCIFDLTGRNVRTLPINSNNTSIKINENELNAGTYYYCIKVNDQLVKTKKLVIVK